MERGAWLIVSSPFLNLQVAKVLLVVGLGFLYTLSTVSFTVLFLRTAQGTAIKSSASSLKSTGPAAASSKPYSDDTMSFLMKGTVISAAASIAASRTGNDYAIPLRTIFHMIATCATFVWGARLPASFTKVVHPLITSTALTLGIVRLTGLATGASFLDVLKTYKVGSLDLMKAGAGDLLLFLLGPTVVSFSVAMYGRRKLLKENFPFILTAILVSSVGGLFGTAAFVRAIKLGGSGGGIIRLSVLSRNVTTALSMAIAGILGGDMSICAVVVVLTGVLGATFGRTLLNAFGIFDPVARGLGIGSAAQGLGVASLVPEPDAFPFAAISLVLTAISATVLVSIPAVKESLVSLAIGA